MPKRGQPRTLFESRVFRVNEVDITFDNGVELAAQFLDRNHGVMAVPIDREGNVVFINEYAPAMGTYELGLPKGKLPSGADPAEHVQIELQEEIHYRAGRLDTLGELTVSPGYSTRVNHLFLARDLEVSPLEGDEAEALELVLHPFDQFEELIECGRLREARMISALYLARKHVQHE